MHLITAASGPNDPSPSAPQVRVRAFNSNTTRWRNESLAWLLKMKDRGLRFTEAHTVWIEGSSRSASFIFFVCEAVQGPLPPLPRDILDRWEVHARFGKVIHVDCQGSPPLIRVHEGFWAGPSEGASHFESLVRPLMDKMIASFGKGESWAS